MNILPLREVCSRIVDCPHETPEWKETGIPVIRNYNLIDGHIDTNNLSFVNEETYQKRVRREVPQKDDVIFSREAPIGNCGIIPEAFKCCLGQRLVLLRANRDVCSPTYLITVLQSDYVRQQIEQVSKRGSIVSNFAIEDLKELLIPIIDNQDDVAHLYTLLSDKISNNTEITVLLEKQAKLLYDYWFVRFDFPDENGKPYKTSGGKMVWNKELKREIPDGWEVNPLPAVSHLRYGFPLSTSLFGNDGLGVVRIRDIIDNSTSAYTTEQVSADYLTEEGDLLVGMDGNFQMNYWIRKGNVVNQRITRIRKKNLPLMIIKMQIEPYINAKITSVARSTVGHLSDSDFKNQLIIIPHNLDVEVFDVILSKIVELRQENQELVSLRDFLLPMLMNGQVKIKE